MVILQIMELPDFFALESLEKENNILESAPINLGSTGKVRGFHGNL